MAYKLADEAILDQRVAKARQIMLTCMVPGQEYTAEELLVLLAEHGLDLANPAYTEVGQALIAGNVIQGT